MRVLYISTGDYKYGAPKALMEMISILKKDYAVEPVVLTKMHNGVNEYCDKRGIENYSFFHRDIMSTSMYDNKCKNTLKHVIKYGIYLVGGFLHPAINRIGLDFATIDIVHANTNRTDLGVYISKNYHIPHILHLREMNGNARGMKFYKKSWQEYLNRNTDVFVAITETVKKSWQEVGLQEDKIRVIYDGVDETDIETSKDFSLDKDIIKIVSVGHIEKHKGQADIVHAICLLDKDKQSRLQIDFIGEGYEEYISYMKEELSRNECLARVNFLGYCSDVHERLGQYDVGITCSREEGFGRTTVEYMMAGLLTIGSNIEANLEIIEEQKNGLIYLINEENSLADLLDGVIDGIYDVTKLRENAYSDVRDKYTAKMNARNISELYTTVYR